MRSSASTTAVLNTLSSASIIIQPTLVESSGLRAAKDSSSAPVSHLNPGKPFRQPRWRAHLSGVHSWSPRFTSSQTEAGAADEAWHSWWRTLLANWPLPGWSRHNACPGSKSRVRKGLGEERRAKVRGDCQPPRRAFAHRQAGSTEPIFAATMAHLECSTWLPDRARRKADDPIRRV